MSNNEDLEIRNALRGSAAFDSGQAEEMLKKARGQYAKAMRYITWYTNVAVLVAAAAGASCLAFLTQTNSDRLGMLALCYLIIGIVTVSMVKLWFWIVYAKISTLKDLRETVLALRGNANDAWLHEDSPMFPQRRRRLFFAAVLMVAILGSLIGAYAALETARFESVVYSDIAINPDGSVTIAGKIGFINDKRLPMVEAQFNSGTDPKLCQYFDIDGQPMNLSVTQVNNQYFYTLKPAKPVMKGEWFWYTTKSAIEAGTPDADGTRTLTWNNCVPGKRSYYRYDFTLPPGSEVLSPLPPDAGRTLEDNRLRVTYNREMGISGGLVPFTLKYRLKS